MSLLAHYDAMRAAALRQLAQGAATPDPLLDAPADDRRGITLLARPPAAVLQAIGAIVSDFQCIDPEQYYYPATDMHLTILSIISCYSGFELASIVADDYRRLVAAVVQRTPPLRFRFVGLTASTGGILVQGFPVEEGLATLRAELRAAFRHSSLQQSIDQRYSIQTAHTTIIRFRTALADPSQLLGLLAKYQHHAIGAFEIDSLELVFNDWYQRQANTVLLKKYPLYPADIK